MNSGTRNAPHPHRSELEEIKASARPLEQAGQLDRMVELWAPARFVCLGEASRGTQEYLHHERLPNEPELETEPTGL